MNPGVAQEGMLVFHTALGFHYWDNGLTSWLPLGGGGPEWAFAGNATAGTEILGTTNGDDLRIWAGGAERQKIQSNGQILMNMAAPVWINDILSVEGIFAVNGYSNSATGIGVYGEGTVGGEGVVGISTSGIGTFGGSTTGPGLQGESINNIGTIGLGNLAGVLGDVGAGVGTQGQATSGIGAVGLATSGDGVWGVTTSGEGVYGDSDSGDGVWGVSTDGEGVYGYSETGDGMWGISNSGNGVFANSNSGTGILGISNAGTGVYGTSNNMNFYAGEFFNSDANGHGLVASGNSVASTIIPGTGAGVSGTGSKYGTLGFGSGTSSTGIVGVANGLTTFSTIAPNGSGVSGTGTDVGMAGFSTANDGLGVFGQGGNNANGVGVQGQGTYGVVGLSGTGNGDLGVFGEGKIGVLGEASSTTGINNYGVFSNGDSGASGVKTFNIDHPLDPANKFLKHASIESNEILNLYRGTATFDGNGQAKVQLPNYYDAVNKNPSYQLTAIGASMPDLFIEREVENGIFIIAGGKPGKKVSWQITAERNDPYLQQHPEKRNMEIDKGSLKGQYLMPDLYGKSEELSLYKSLENIGHTVIKTESATSSKDKIKQNDKVKKTKEVSKLEVQPARKKKKSKD
ncbi:MAG: hypothetical protein KJO77_05465 [Bacteroidia bacterium]|nr:hypothetical protein [Bacteroidia bacterium]